jgi:Flp pilus assembly protein TadG
MKKTKFARNSSGQALIETALLMPLLLTLALNCVNFGYLFIVALNVAEAPRSGSQYSILGFQTPASLTLPAAGPPSTATTVSYLNQQDMTGAVTAPTGASIQVCSSTVGMTATGVSKCETCTGTTCGAVNTGNPAPAADPEAPNFVLNRVDVNYVFSPPIPGLVFNLALLPLQGCSSGAGGVTCTFHRQVSMREMN